MKVHRSDFAVWSDWLIKDCGYAPSSAALRLRAVRLLYRFLADEGYLKVNPAARVKAIKVPDKRQPYMKRAAMMRYLDAAEKHSPKHHALVCLMMLNGLRVAEVCSIQVEDIFQNRGLDEIKVRRKGSKISHIALAPRTSYAIRQYLGPRSSGPLFLSGWGNPMDKACATRAVKIIAKRAGVTGRVSPHALRRSGITEALGSGIPVQDVQHWAGHADPRTTSRYDQRRHEVERRTALMLQGILSD